MRQLTPRQHTILNRVIDVHIETAQPVGSRYIVNLYQDLYRSTYSPATIRNEMGVLEETGYLTHPHTSAGRVPTDQGYRYYVSNGLKSEAIGDDWDQEMQDNFTDAQQEIETIAEKAASFLSFKTNQISLIVMPIRNSWGPVRQYRFFLHGSSRLLGKPEFQDVRKAKALFEAIEETNSFMEWLSQKVADAEVSISIGKENDAEALEDCSVVVSRIHSEQHSALISVIGPRRMRYARTLAMVKKMSHVLGHLFESGRAAD